MSRARALARLLPGRLAVRSLVVALRASRGRFTSSSRGFSLLEVMVAIGILGLAVTVILSAQGGLAATNKGAADMGQAVTIGRCRMTELEERLIKLGYSEVDEIDSSRACCDDREIPGFSCQWRVEKILLPPPPNTTGGDGGLSFGVGMDGGVPGIISGFASGIGLDGGAGGIAGLLGGDGGLPMLDLDAGLSGIGQMLGGGQGALGLLSMVFSIIYPSLKPVLEASIRRVTVVVKWTEGLKDRDFTLVEFVTNPRQANFAAGYNADGGVTSGGTTTGSTTSTAGATSPLGTTSPLGGGLH